MSDFLSRLAQRSLGAAPLIAPRLPSVFAPFEHEGAARDVSSFISQSASGTDDALSDSPQPALSLSLRVPRAERGNAEAPNVVYASPLSFTGEGEKTAAYNNTGVPQRKSDDAAFPSVAHMSAQPLPNPSPTRAERLVPGDTQNRVPTSNSDFTADESKYAPTASSPSPLAGEGPGEREPPPLVPANKMNSSETPAPSTFAADMADRHGSPAPTIHISIGRIEVRANTAPPPAPRPRTEPKPTQSLADYLKRGGRQA